MATSRQFSWPSVGSSVAAYGQLVMAADMWGICVSSLRQRLVPEHLRGRVNASSKVLGLIGLT
ncbi:MAG: hypothetical protein LH624_10105, partial [Cryobacterium sp.]|nr:hypothetical protein [Cryobacterium sp.]